MIGLINFLTAPKDTTLRLALHRARHPWTFPPGKWGRAQSVREAILQGKVRL